nr:MAG TPA: hypothetical protein [Herelleviridae sp.]
MGSSHLICYPFFFISTTHFSLSPLPLFDKLHTPFQEPHTPYGGSLSI